MDNLTTGQIVAISIIAIVCIALLFLAFYMYISNEKRENRLYEMEREKKRKLEEELSRIQKERELEQQRQFERAFEVKEEPDEQLSFDIPEKQVPSETSQIDFQEVLSKLQEAVGNESNRDMMNKYEEDQEEEAIISYKQLVEAHNKMVEEPKEEAVISYKELMETHNSLEDYSKKVEPKKTYSGTEFISPVFGREPYNVEYRNLRDLQDTKNKQIKVDEISDEVKKNDEFLKTLKNFRKNL